MNLTEFARCLTKLEGRGHKLNTHQVKDMVFCVAAIFANLPDEGRDLRKKMVAAYKKKRTPIEIDRNT